MQVIAIALLTALPLKNKQANLSIFF